VAAIVEALAMAPVPVTASAPVALIVLAETTEPDPLIVSAPVPASVDADATAPVPETGVGMSKPALKALPWKALIR
jgi:hypothetical protein